MNTRHALYAIIAACIAVQVSHSETRNLLFMSGSVETQIKKKFHTVETFDGKRFQVSGSRKPVKVTGKTNCFFVPEMVVSSMYSEISDIDYQVDSLASRLREMATINEMNAEQMRYEAGADFESARARMDGRNALERVTEREGKVAAIDELTKNQIDSGVGELNPERLFDNIRGSYSVNAESSMGNAYAATVLTFDGVNPRKGVGGRRETFVRMGAIGDLVAGESKEVTFDFEFPEMTASSVKLDFFLFDGNGEPIATNRSRGLQQLSDAQLEEFKSLQKKRGKQ